MSIANLTLLAFATAAFVAAASAAKAWAVSDDSWALLCLTLALYTIGNLVMLRLVRDMGMGAALSLAAVLQLAAINLIAVVVFGERLSVVQGAGLVLAVAAVALIAWPSGQ